MYKFYSNFQRKMKFMGIIQYDHLIYIVLIIVTILKISEVLNLKWITTVYILIITIIPTISLLYSVSLESDENKYTFLNLIKYIISNKKYVHIPILKFEC